MLLISNISILNAEGVRSDCEALILEATSASISCSQSYLSIESIGFSFVINCSSISSKSSRLAGSVNIFSNYDSSLIMVCTEVKLPQIKSTSPI